MSKKVTKKTDVKKERKPLNVEKTKGGFQRVVMTHGVEFWKPEINETIEGEYMETMERENKGAFADAKPIQRNPVIKIKDGSQVYLPDNWMIHQVIADHKPKVLNVTFLGQSVSKGKKYNNYDVLFK